MIHKFEVQVENHPRFGFYTLAGAKAFAANQLPRSVIITDLEAEREIYLEPGAVVRQIQERYARRPKRDKITEQILSFNGLVNGCLELEPLRERTAKLVDMGLTHGEAIDQAKAEMLKDRAA